MKYKGTYTNNFLIQEISRLVKNPRNQISSDILADLQKTNDLVRNILQRQIEFRTACNEVVQTEMTRGKILSHFDYLNHPSIRDNSQLRGIQTHLSNAIFREAYDNNPSGFKGMDHLLSGKSLGESQVLDTKYLPQVETPPSYNTVSGNSFSQGLEYFASRMFSGSMGFRVINTDDKPLNDPWVVSKLNNNPIINNGPIKQKNSDLLLETEKANLTNDIKQQAAANILNEPSKQRLAVVGAVIPKEDVVLTQGLAGAARANLITGNSGIRHLNNNNPRDTKMENRALTNYENSRDIHDLRHMLGMPLMLNTHKNKGRITEAIILES